MTDYKLDYIVMGVERSSYVRAKNANAAMQRVRDAFPQEIIAGFVVTPNVARPESERELPVTMIFPTTHYEPVGFLPSDARRGQIR